MRNIMLALVVVAVALGAGGCGTMADLTRRARPFGGLQTDFEAIENAGCKSAVVVPLAIMDMPCSAALDLVVLPVTTLHTITR